jgi:hypothetical protein
MVSEDIDLVRSLSSHVDDDAFEKEVLRYVLHDRSRDEFMEDVIHSIRYVLEDNYDDCEVYDDKGLLEWMVFYVKDDFQYIDLLFSLGKDDLAIREMNLLADAITFAQTERSCKKYGRFLKGMEIDLREHMDSGDPKKWFDHSHISRSSIASLSDGCCSHDTDGDLPHSAQTMVASCGPYDTYHEEDIPYEVEAIAKDLIQYLPSEMLDEILDCIIYEDYDELRKLIREGVIEDSIYEYRIKSVFFNAMSALFDHLLDNGFSDDVEVQKYLTDNVPIVTEHLRSELTRELTLIPLMEALDMHNDVVRFLSRLTKQIDTDIREHRFMYDYFAKGMSALSKTMHRSISKRDPTSWMDESILKNLRKRYEYL